MNFTPDDLLDLSSDRILQFHLDFPREYLKKGDADFTGLFLAPLVLAAQPSQGWIKKINTSDQVKYWVQASLHFYCIAKCWVAQKTFQKDPLRPLLKEGAISRNTYNIVWFSQKAFERLWDIVQLVAPFVQESFERNGINYPFPDEVSLFACLVGEMIDSEFSLCFARYAHFSKTRQEKALRLQAKAYAGEELTEPQKKLIKTVEARRPKTSLGNAVFSIARQAAKEEIIIQAALEDYEIAWGRLLKAYATKCHNEGCHTWIHGRIVRSSS
jgi:hypothetical protein